jgi:hypothetical protein
VLTIEREGYKERNSTKDEMIRREKERKEKKRKEKKRKEKNEQMEKQR